MGTLPSCAVVLAAGLGTRMRSPVAKVLHPLLGRPMVGWVVEALREAGVHRVIVVVHHQADAVRAALPDVEFAEQVSPRGTGDAVAAALPLLPRAGPVVVAAGDTPLLTAGTVRRLLAEARGACTVASFELPDPAGYGRIVRAGGTRIVEEAECGPAERAIREVNSGLYCFDAAWLHAGLPRLRPHPPKDELYLTDLVTDAAHVLDGFEATELLGVNDRAALAEARGVLRRRVNRAWAKAGVDFEDLDHASIDVQAVLDPDATVGWGARVEGKSHVGGWLGANVVVRDSRVAPGAKVHAGSILEGARVSAGAVVGPMARLRPGAVIEDEAHIGNFVEVKAAIVRRGAKANHLAYVGDADIGEGANLGAGTITCNYDGVRKHHTHVGARAFVGSNVALVAPVRVGEDALVGAGSTVTADVPADAIYLERSEARVRPGAASRLRARLRARDPA